jgi:UDP-GlcNAc:undecaprenyl-phosphate/decaprenyl-phosphate GlcNAc-1-phosphate transferase
MMFPQWQEAADLAVPASAFLLTTLSVPICSRGAARWKCIALPNAERWHRRSTPTSGGLAFFFPILLLSIGFSAHPWSQAPYLLIVTAAFCLGVYDDLRHLTPAAKLLGQIVAAGAAVFYGFQLHFFAWEPLDVLLTTLWIIGLTNALNLLDNMDGLAGGIGLIAAFYLAYLFYVQGDHDYFIVALAFAGGVAGFLLFNFHPASIFMGDAGSLFLGMSLSLLTIHANGQASNILSLIAVPACILLVPILDTTLVTVTRLLRGQPVSQGGKDHASHRLVFLGLSESQAVLLLYFVAAVSGATAVVIKQLSYTLSLALFPLIILTFTLFTVYLAQVELVSGAHGSCPGARKKLTSLLSELAYKRRLMEVTLDFFLIAFAYYLAFGLRFEFRLGDSLMTLYLASLPIVVVTAYVAFLAMGVYRGLWRYTGLDDLVRIGAAALSAGGLAMAALTVLYGFVGYSRVVFILYALLLFVGMAGSRLSFRLFGLFIDRPRPERIPILVYGASDRGEAVVRECRRNPEIGYCPIGFLDDDPTKEGRSVSGLRIFGGADKLPQILQRNQVCGCIIASPDLLARGQAQEIRALCEPLGLWVKLLQFEFIEEGAIKS